MTKEKTEKELPELKQEVLLEKDFSALNYFKESMENINQFVTLPNGDQIKTDDKNATTFYYNSDFNQFGTYQKMRKQLDYSIEYAQDRTLWVSYLMWKYEDEIVNYISSSEYKDKHCITTSGMKTEDLCEIDSLESLLDTFSQYITTKRFNDDKDEQRYNIEKEQAYFNNSKEKASLSYAYSKKKEDNYKNRFVATDFSGEGSVENSPLSKATERLNTEGATSHLSLNDNILKGSTMSKKYEKTAFFGEKSIENTEKTLKNAEKYLKQLFDNKLKTEIPRHFESTLNIIKRSIFSEHIDTHIDTVEWRNKLITEYKESIYEIEKSLGYYDENGLETSSEYRKEFYESLRSRFGYKANNLRKLRSEMMSQFKVMFDSLLFVVKGDDMSHLYKGDLTLLNMNDVETYKALLVEYSKLHDSAAKDIDSELKWMLWELDDLIDRTIKNDTERLIVECLKQGMSQVETASTVAMELNQKTTRQSINQFLSEGLPVRLLSKHKKDMDSYVYTYRVKGRYKTCKGNGKAYLATDRYFRLDKKGKDGLRSVSKEFDSSLR